MAQVLPALRTVRLTVGVAHDVTVSVRLQSPTEIAVHFTRDSAPPSPIVMRLADAVTMGSMKTAASVEGTGSITEARFTLVVPHAEALTAGELAVAAWLPGGLGRGGAISEDEAMKGLSEVLCDTCGTVLFPPGRFKRILPLPSPYWQELAEMWVCHEDFACRSPMSKITPAGHPACPS